jgi:uncharacterized protein (DUF1499 family)
MILKILAGTLIVLGLVVILRFFLLGASSKAASPELGLQDGRLAPCPRKRNCVSSLAKGRAHRIAPIAAAGPLDEAMMRAREAIASTSGSRVVEIEGEYLRAEFTSRLFGFVDDLELLWNPAQEIFDVRSASRVGHGDLGANRRRVEALRERIESPER